MPIELGRLIAGKYLVEEHLGSGWEGEVYKIIEQQTGIRRAFKIFHRHRDKKDRRARIFAQKLHRLRHCPLVFQYHHLETLFFDGQPRSCLVSDFVEGELLSSFISKQPGGRMHIFEALHLLYALARGMEQIHAAREYHCDIHSENVLIRRHGIGFRIKLIDFFDLGRTTTAKMREDIIQLVQLFHECLGGRPRYSQQPPVAKAICRGLRRQLIIERFPTMSHLRQHLESFPWS